MSNIKKSLKTFIEKTDKMICDDSGNTSSKRIIGAIIFLVAIPTAFWILWYGIDVTDNQTEILTGLIVAGGSLIGMTAIEKFRR